MKHVTLLCLLITAVYIPLAYLDYQHTPYSDGAEHGAVLRELIRDIKSPGEPMLETFTGKSPRYVPSLFLMASVARLAGMNALSTIKLFSILFFIFFLTSIIFFVRQYFQDPEQAFWSVACMLFLWGTGWTGANAYMFSALVYTAWYPSLVAFSCVFMALWPYYDFFASLFTITSGSMATASDFLLTRNYLYSDIALRAGPALAIIPILFFYLLKKKYSMLTNLLLCALCIYTAGYFLRISLAERFIFAIIFSSQILVSRYACTLWQDLRQHTAAATQTACAALLAVLLASGCIGQLYITMQEYIFPNFTLYSNAPYIRYEDPTALHKQFALYMQPDDIVFSDLYTSWGIPLYTGAKIVSLFHTPPHVQDNDARKAEVNRFYDPSLSNLQRLQILKNFNATKLVIHFPVAGQDIRKQITSMGLPLIMQSDEVCIFNVPSGNDRLKPTNMYHN
jgi:hypothetical protein